MVSPDKVRFFRVQDLPDAELYQTNGASRSVARHVHSVFSASVMLSGSRIHETRQGSFLVRAGDILVVNIGEVHGNIGNGAATSAFALRLLPEFLRRYAGEITGRSDNLFPLAEPVIRDSALARQLLRTQAILENSPHQLEKEEEILIFLATLFSRHARESFAPVKLGKERKSVARACDYLQSCTAENVSLETLAGIAGLSPFHFTRLFTRTVGVSPHQYQLQMRLKKATDLLAAGNLATDVAFATGFCDQSHLQKEFKKKFGISPGRYGC